MKFYEKYNENIFIRKGVLFALCISIFWPILSWFAYYILDFIRMPTIVSDIFYYLDIVIDFIQIQIFLSPFYIEINFFTVFKAWIVIRFLVFAIFGYYNGLLYEKISSKFKHSKTYFVVISLLFYYIILGILQLVGIIFYGGLP